MQCNLVFHTEDGESNSSVLCSFCESRVPAGTVREGCIEELKRGLVGESQGAGFR